MKIIDLSHTLEEEMPVFPGTEKPKLENACTLKTHGFREKLLTMYSHTGTHMDAPAHMLESGLCLDELNIDRFFGKAYVLDCTLIHKAITVEDLPEKEVLMNLSFLLLNTGWDKKWGKKEYFSDFPALTKEAAIYLSKFDLKGLGTDAISVDLITSKTFDVHKILLNKNMVMIENLTGLELIEDFCDLSVLPLKIKEADGSPIRAVAYIGLDY